MSENNIKIFVEYGLDFDNNKYGFGRSIEVEYPDGTESRNNKFVKIRRSDKVHARYFRIWIGKFMMVIDTDKPHISFKKKKRWNFKIIYGISRHIEIKKCAYAAYILPVREINRQKQVAMVIYKSGWPGCIGGRLDDGETAHQAVCREVCEELGNGAQCITADAIQIPTTNKIKIKDVLFRRAENEEHTYFVKKVPADTELIFCEKGKSGFYIKWMNLESFGDEEVIKIPDMRQYFINSVIPFIKSEL